MEARKVSEHMEITTRWDTCILGSSQARRDESDDMKYPKSHPVSHSSQGNGCIISSGNGVADI